MTYAIYDSSCTVHSHSAKLREAFEKCKARRANGWREAYVINPEQIDLGWQTGLTEDEEDQLEVWESER